MFFKVVKECFQISNARDVNIVVECEQIVNPPKKCEEVQKKKIYIYIKALSMPWT